MATRYVTTDPSLRKSVLDQADRLFARAYARDMKQNMDRYINNAIAKVLGPKVESQEDLSRLCDVIDGIVKNAPTLQGFKIDIDRLGKAPFVLEAKEISENFAKELEKQLRDALADRIAEFKQAHAIDFVAPGGNEDFSQDNGESHDPGGDKR
jgi:hypothetical protein